MLLSSLEQRHVVLVISYYPCCSVTNKHSLELRWRSVMLLSSLEQRHVVLVISCYPCCSVTNKYSLELRWNSVMLLSFLEQRHVVLVISRVGQNRIIYTEMTVYLVISLPKIPYIHRIYMVLANPSYFCIPFLQLYMGLVLFIFLFYIKQTLT